LHNAHLCQRQIILHQTKSNMMHGPFCISNVLRYVKSGGETRSQRQATYLS